MNRLVILIVVLQYDRDPAVEYGVPLGWLLRLTRLDESHYHLLSGEQVLYNLCMFNADGFIGIGELNLKEIGVLDLKEIKC